MEVGRTVLKNCKQCNKVFAHPTRHLCEGCYKDAQAQFERVREYLEENRGATVAEVAEETDTDVEVIYEYIKEGRLTVVPKDAELRCQICGTKIASGRVCAVCRAELSDDPRIPPSQQGDKDTRMRYLDAIRRKRR